MSLKIFQLLPMNTAPKDRPILAYCQHEADPYVTEDPRILTTYGAHCESLSHVEDGFHVVEWGGEYVDSDGSIPDWWFRFGSEFEEVASPIAFMELPDLPEWVKK